ncbi:MAG: hypothetical protein LBH06_00030 [Rikenellaceae bacterium]|jgi:hypothetical protein|nr:hypothetical protein [Rikenellaceae bacterium]
MYIAIDFDGTIVRHRYPAIGEEIPFAIETIRLIQSELGHQVILWTAREGKLLDEAVEYCRARGLEFYAVNQNHPGSEQSAAPRKLTVDMFIDDRNFGGLPEWGVIYNTLKNSPGDLFSLRAFASCTDMPSKRRRKLFGR